MDIETLICDICGSKVELLDLAVTVRIYKNRFRKESGHFRCIHGSKFTSEQEFLEVSS